MGSIGQAAVTGAASATVTIEAPPSPARASYRMTLRTPATTDDRRVQWHQQTVDNENMGKKKSKKCCIYQKPRAFGESSTESDSSSEGDDRARPARKKKHGHSHGHPDGQHHHHPHHEGDGGNAYEPNTDA